MGAALAAEKLLAAAPLPEGRQVDHVRRAPAGGLHRRGRGRATGFRLARPPAEQFEQVRPQEDAGNERQHDQHAHGRGQRPEGLGEPPQRPAQQIGQQAIEQPERHGQAAALAAQSIEGQSFELDAGQKAGLNEINGQQAKTLAKELNRDNENGDQVKAARAREIAERFKEKAARDREQARSFSR